jgi:hypothetical protein
MNTINQQISLRGNLLRRIGKARSLDAAEAHNRRKIPVELSAFAHIDPSKSTSNHELISLGGMSLEDAILAILNQAGVDLKDRTNKRKDKAYAIEWLFTVTLGYPGNHLHLYADCLSWLESYFSNCPLVHAVIHYDENEPHMHVIMVPLEGNRLPASDLLSYKGASKARLNSLYAAVGAKHGLIAHTKLTGAMKKAAAAAVIEDFERRGIPIVLQNAWSPMKTCIKNSPDGFLDPLGISIANLSSVSSGLKPRDRSQGGGAVGSAAS